MCVVVPTISGTVIDKNPDQEDFYEETCRSVACEWNVKDNNKIKMSRCPFCAQVWRTLRIRERALLCDSPHPNTPKIV